MNNEIPLNYQETLGEIASILDELRKAQSTLATSPLLTIKEASKMLNVSPSLIRKWVFQGQIKTYRIGKCVRLKVCDLEQRIMFKN